VTKDGERGPDRDRWGLRPSKAAIVSIIVGAVVLILRLVALRSLPMAVWSVALGLVLGGLLLLSIPLGQRRRSASAPPGTLAIAAASIRGPMAAQWLMQNHEPVSARRTYYIGTCTMDAGGLHWMPKRSLARKGVVQLDLAWQGCSSAVTIPFRGITKGTHVALRLQDGREFLIHLTGLAADAVVRVLDHVGIPVKNERDDAA
jgi:hypothetical protein